MAKSLTRIGRCNAAAHRQQGAAAVSIALLLCAVLALAVAFVNRGLVFEQRAAANQHRATLAFEAAEAGLDWAQALLNGRNGLDAACLPTSITGAQTLRDRWLEFHPATQRLVPRLDPDGSALSAVCHRGASGWTCDCPGSGAPLLAAGGGSVLTPGFRVQLQALPRPGEVRLSSRGCAHADAACLVDSSAGEPARAELQVDLALVGGLRTLPAAAVTAAGDVQGHAPGAHQADPAAGVAVHTGGHVSASQLRVSAGSGDPDEAVVTGDAALKALADNGRLFSSVFGLNKAAWRGQSAVTPIDCDGNCGPSLWAASAGRSNAMLHAASGMVVEGPISLGTPERPVLLVVDGPLELRGAVVLHGGVFAASVRWDDAGPAGSGAAVNGAVISEGHLASDGAPDFVYDGAVLNRLRWHTGGFVRVPGSWRDFTP